jgi:hypothetical protein
VDVVGTRMGFHEALAPRFDGYSHNRDRRVERVSWTGV